MVALDPIALVAGEQLVQLPPNVDVVEALLDNESPYSLKVTIGSHSEWLGAWRSKVYDVTGSATFKVTAVVVGTQAQAPSTSLLVTLATRGETIGPPALNMDRAVNISAGSVSVAAGTVNIGTMPAVSISSGTVNIGTMPAVTIASGTVSIGNTAQVNIASQSVTLNVLQITASVTGALVNIGDTLVLNLTGQTTLAVIVTLAVVPNDNRIIIEGSVDGGVHWAALPIWAYVPSAGGRPIAQVPFIWQTAVDPAGFQANLWKADISGMDTVRLRKVSGSTAASWPFSMIAASSPLVLVPPTATVWKGPLAASIAQGASLTVWTPSSNARWNLLWFLVSADATGELQLTDGGTQVMSINEVARQSASTPLPQNGLPSTAINNVLALGNNTGAATGLHAVVAGFESA